MRRPTLFISVLALCPWLACGRIQFSGGERHPGDHKDPAASDAGGMSTGGGLLYGNGGNPWFLENTSRVSYCVDQDPDHFHQSKDVVSTSIRRGIEAWSAAFKNAYHLEYYKKGELAPFDKISLATQEFVEEPCSANTDLRFQLGRLSEAQQKLIPDLDHTIAITVRTAYDLKKLRGKGFIYIAPDSGQARPLAEAMADNPWGACDGCILTRVITHELGHMFGLPHSGSSRNDIMSERHVEFVVERDFLKEIVAAGNWDQMQAWVGRPLDVFGFPETLEHTECSADWIKSSRNFFADPKERSCVMLRFDIAQGTTGKLSVFASNKAGDIPEPVGGVEFDSSSSSTEELLHLHITREQEVFSKIPDEAYGSTGLVGLVSRRDLELTGIYISQDSKTQRSISVRLNPYAHFSIIGDMEGELINILRQ